MSIFLAYFNCLSIPLLSSKKVTAENNKYYLLTVSKMVKSCKKLPI